MTSAQESRRTEIIAVASGKGGTGKSLFAASLGNALVRSKLNVLMIDADPGTDGLSLFLLGPEGWRQLSVYDDRNTFVGYLRTPETHQVSQANFEPRRINRLGQQDHRAIYTALVSARSAYGDQVVKGQVVPELDREAFRRKIQVLFENLRHTAEYDYVIVDTRGGFAFESSDVCALADSFVVVTEPDYTSFYQDRNLVGQVGAAADELQRKPLLRAMVVNKATSGDEREFRLALEREFPVTFNDTYALPLDIEAILAYKSQKIPFVAAPSSRFSYATITALASILRVVTAQWTESQIQAWESLVGEITDAITARNAQIEAAEQASKEQQDTLKRVLDDADRVKKERDALERELERARDLYRMDRDRSDESRGRANGQKGKARESADFESMEYDLDALPDSRSVFRRRIIIGVILGAILPAALVVFTVLERTSRPEVNQSPVRLVTSAEASLRDLYSADVPPPLRLRALSSLLAGGGTTFDALNLSNIDMSGRNLRGLTGMRMRLAGANFSGSDLSGARLPEVDLSGATMRGVNLSNANLVGADLRHADLSNAILRGADLREARISPATLDGADLTRANLHGASISPSDLKAAKPTVKDLDSLKGRPNLQERQSSVK